MPQELKYLINTIPLVLLMILIWHMALNYKNYQQCPKTGEVISDERLISIAMAKVSETPIAENCCRVLKHPEGFSDSEKFLAKISGAYVPLVQVKFTNKYGRKSVSEVQLDSCGKIWESR